MKFNFFFYFDKNTFVNMKGKMAEVRMIDDNDIKRWKQR